MAERFQHRFRPGLPPAAARWQGYPRYNFVGGHNDAGHVPVDKLIEAVTAVLKREGQTLARYGLDSGPLGYRPLREFLAGELARRTGMDCDAEEILLTSGSLQAIDLVYGALLSPGDAVVREEANYGGVISRLNRLGVRKVGIEVDADGMRMDRLAEALDRLAAEGQPPKLIYTIPTVQNPTGTVMSEARRVELLRLAKAHDLPVFEDDCYADLLWDGRRPPAIRALDDDGRVIYCGSFSKTVAPALRVGYLVAPWPALGQMLALKTDAGSGALEQMVLAEFAVRNFGDHVEGLTAILKDKCETMMAALDEHFGTQVEFAAPKGGIFLWVTFPDAVDTTALAAAALADGVEINPGAEWSADPEAGRHRARLCFASATKQEITEGIARLAEICHRETGIPTRSANIER